MKLVSDFVGCILILPLGSNMNWVPVMGDEEREKKLLSLTANEHLSLLFFVSSCSLNLGVSS